MKREVGANPTRSATVSEEPSSYATVCLSNGKGEVSDDARARRPAFFGVFLILRGVGITEARVCILYVVCM